MACLSSENEVIERNRTSQTDYQFRYRLKIFNKSIKTQFFTIKELNFNIGGVVL
jgi:hypothetical protein